MIKKIAGITILLLVTGVLVYGAINRTQAKSGDDERNTEQTTTVETASGGQGRGRTVTENNAERASEHTAVAETTSGGQGWGRTDRDATAEQSGGNGGNAEAPRRGQVQNQAQETALVEAEEHEHEWLTVQGVVAAIDADHLLVDVKDGSQIEIVDRPWDFARQAGFSAQVGDSVKLIGFDEEGVFELGAIENLASGEQTQIREESGRPLWAGRGRWGR